MIKNKEDDFLGDNLTNNIKYAENEWQAAGTTDRNSMYTKEPLMHMLFEGVDYDPDIGDYSKFIARGSTSTGLGKPFSPAKLQHDLSVIDLIYYLSTPTASSINIFDIQTYLKKAVAVANPVYDDKARYQQIPMFDAEYIKSVLLNQTPKHDITLAQFLQLLNPNNYLSGKLQIPNYVDTEWVRSFTHRYGDGGYENKYADLYKLPLSKYLNLPNVKAEQFFNDFSLHLHDNNAVKMPFNVRGTLKEESKDVRTYLTRFLLNTVSGEDYRSSLTTKGYTEFLNDLVEESLFMDSFREMLNTVPVDVSIALQSEGDEGPVKDNDAKTFLQKYGNTLKHLLENDPNDFSEKLSVKNPELCKTLKEKYGVYLDLSESKLTVLSDMAVRLESIKKAPANKCTEVFLGHVNAVNFRDWGIHFENEEDTSNLFQDEDNSYKLFNTVVLGYTIVDALISYRTFLGGIFYLFSTSTTNLEGLGISNTIDGTAPIHERIVNEIPQKLLTEESWNNGYYTISILNALYKVGHGQDVNNVSLPENDEEEIYSYDFAEPIKKWLENECLIFKTPVYGDYVEELNFMQDLTPDSDVQFNNLRVKKTSIPYKRFQDSKYEIPYLEQTNPLINNTPESEEGMGVYGSDVFAGVGNIKGKDEEQSTNTLPPFIYDYDKGNEGSKIPSADRRTKMLTGNPQRVNNKNGNLAIESRIISPTIDELWVFLKYLTESDGSGTPDSAVNARLPSFYGTRKSAVEGTFLDSIKGSAVAHETVNPMVAGEDISQHPNLPVIDILGWQPVATKEGDDALKYKMHYSSKEKPELQFGGYQITQYIEQVFDYKVDPFSREWKMPKGQAYEYNTEISTDFNKVHGYLETLYNSAILAFALNDMVNESGYTWTKVNETTKGAHVLEELEMFNPKNDAKLITDDIPITDSVERKAAFDAISRILTWHKAKDGQHHLNEGEETSYHNHYKKYLKNPKNLKEIERDLETIRQNLQALSEFATTSFASMGFADRSYNRGTLLELHRNHFHFTSTLIDCVNNTEASVENSIYDFKVTLLPLQDAEDLNNFKDYTEETFETPEHPLTVTEMDRRVVFEDGSFEQRYLRKNYDRWVIDLQGPKNNTRAKHDMYRVNETLLSEVYLAADGTWRSVHEHPVAPVVYDEY